MSQKIAAKSIFKPFWLRKFSYSHYGLSISLAWISGLALEVTAPGGVKLLSVFPEMITLFGILAVLTSSLLFLFPSAKLLDGLINKRFVFTLLCSFLLLTSIAGFIPQQTNFGPKWLSLLGLNSILGGWIFFWHLILISLSLLVGIQKRLFPLNLQNFFFVINHLGLLVILLGMGLGSSSIKRLKFHLKEGESSSIAYDNEGQAHKMPFTLKLKDFHMEQFDPHILLVGKKDGKIKERIRTKSTLKKGAVFTVGSWIFTIETYYKYSMFQEDKFVPISHFGDTPSALIIGINKNTGQTKKGWITTGSSIIKPRFLEIGNEKLTLSTQKPKNFQSDIEIAQPNTPKKHYKLLVNHPLSIKDWKIYQYGYDETMGRWSNLSTIEAVKDPMINVVYAGLFMLLFGSLYFIFGRERKNRQ